MSMLLVEDKIVSIQKYNGEYCVHINVCDLFGRGYNEFTPIKSDLFLQVYWAWQAHGDLGVLKWRCQRANKKPHSGIVQRLKDSNLWDDDMENLQ